jgi:ABC-type polysaccharide/polyol phosphate export permease
MTEIGDREHSPSLGGGYVDHIPQRVSIRGSSGRTLALADVVETIAKWHLWGSLAWRDIRGRYRRTVLGPFWTVVSSAILIISLGLVYSLLWQVDVKGFLPYFSAGYISWILMTSIIMESCSAFTGAEAIIKSLRLPYTLHIARVVWRNMLVFGHTLTIHIGVLLYFSMFPPISKLFLVLIGLGLLAVNCFWIGLLAAIACARFRDITQVIASLIQIAFFITPIFWPVERLDKAPIARFALADLNPVYHLVDIVRAPLIGQRASYLSYAVLVAMGVLGWLLAMRFFDRFRSRIAYWL